MAAWLGPMVAAWLRPMMVDPFYVSPGGFSFQSTNPFSVMFHHVYMAYGPHGRVSKIKSLKIPSTTPRKLRCHLKTGHPKRKLVFQPSIFRGELWVAERGFTGHFETHPSFEKLRNKSFSRIFRYQIHGDVMCIFQGCFEGDRTSVTWILCGWFCCWLVVRNFVVDW